MTSILHINSSAQAADRSYSRKLGIKFLEDWRKLEPSVSVVHRDLVLEPPPFMSVGWIAASFTPPEARTEDMKAALAVSDKYIAEIKQADVIVLGAPMYNYGMPAVLKAWIDQIARIGDTFSFDLARGDFPIEPVLSGKSLVVLSSRGEFGFEPGGIRAAMNTLDPAIAACAHYLGVAKGDIHSAIVEYQEFGDDRFKRSVAAATERVGMIARSLAKS